MSVDHMSLAQAGYRVATAMRLYRQGVKPASAVLPLVMEQIRGYTALAGELCSSVQQSPEDTVGACAPLQHHPEYLEYQTLQEEDGACD